MLIGTVEAAKRLKISDAHVRRLCKSKEIPANKVGKSWVLNSEDLETYVPAARGRKRKDNQITF
jgi:excisionase family DNA binding protein